jgi:hypothetical protein
MFHRTELLEPFGEELGLRSLPVEERVLLEHRVELLAFGFAPAGASAGRLLHGLLTAVQGQRRLFLGSRGLCVGPCAAPANSTLDGRRQQTHAADMDFDVLMVRPLRVVSDEKPDFFRFLPLTAGTLPSACRRGNHAPGGA